MAKLFEGVRFAVSNTLDDTSRTELDALLQANGATPALPSDERLTHYISNTLPAAQPIDELPEETDAHIVTSTWVSRSVILAARQDEAGFSPDPTLIFSGVVATACDLSTSDLDVLSAGISALGGQWRSALTKDVTHLFALTTGSAKYETGIRYKGDMGLTVVVPHWFDDCVRVGQLIETGPYEWPEPKVLEASWGKEGTERTKSRSPQKLPADKDAVYASVFQEGPVPSPKSVWKGLKLMLSLDLTDSQRAAHEADIIREGGIVVQKVEEADILIMRYRSGPDFVKAYRLNKTIGTLAWLWFVRATGKISRPTDQLLHYPTPRHPIDGFSAHKITITNYTGPDREYLKKLIAILGAEFTADMTGNNSVVIAASMEGKKTQKAVSWSIPVVNHMWLEDCLIQWRHISQAQDKYTYFPPGVDFGKMLGRKGMGRGGYDPSELELIEKEVVAQEQGLAPPSNGPSAPIATGQSAREVEDVVMEEVGDTSMGAYLDRDIQMDVEDDDDVVKLKKKAASPSKAKPGPSRAKPAPKPKSAARKPRSARSAGVEDDDEEPGIRGRNSVESEDEPDDSPTKPRERAAPKLKKGKRVQEASADEEEPVPPVKVKSLKKKPVLPMPEDDEDDAIVIPKSKPSVKRTYGSSSKKPPPVDETDQEGTPPPVSPSKGSLHTPKRTVSVLLPTYEQVKSVTKKTPSRPTRTESIRAQAHEVASESPKRGRVPKSEKAGPSTRSPLSSLSPPPSTKKQPARRPATPLGGAKAVASTPATLTRTPSKRSAASKATQKLREEVMPDVLNFEKERKRGNIRSTWDHEQASARKTEVAKGKKRASMGDGGDQEDDEGEQPERKRRKSLTGKGKGKADSVSSDEEEENDDSVVERPTKSTAKAVAATGKSSGRISKKDPASIKIMTTQVSLGDDVIKAMTKLGVKFTTKPSECTHLVVRGIVRTEKFLCAMANAPIIVTDKWVQTCVNTKHILIEDDFLLKDPVNEEKYDFVLSEAVERARARKVFAGMTFLLTSKVPVDQKLVKAVIVAGGGQALLGQAPTVRTLKNGNKFVISCAADKSVWRSLAEQNYPIYTPELILNGALRQEIDWDNPTYLVEAA
ncbi:hypothetical protein BXZ70DRAFT_986996 [Cristinia sonorae]|uniref:BRCT domain-containing protein n=1 Tax=Cristinia sonorae TaxID=1940300 RepID=A0A8K0US69_9AGAR|nr:hypothetical protein BXZ70DRAFT_986996 [Cristinia sonorae]